MGGRKTGFLPRVSSYVSSSRRYFSTQPRFTFWSKTTLFLLRRCVVVVVVVVGAISLGFSLCSARRRPIIISPGWFMVLVNLFPLPSGAFYSVVALLSNAFPLSWSISASPPPLPIRWCVNNVCSGGGDEEISRPAAPCRSSRRRWPW